MLNLLPYVSILTFIFFFLSVRVIKRRRTLKIGMGDTGNNEMIRAMRVHANFAEYVPLSLFVIYLCEVSGAYPFFIHAAGLLLVLGRLTHAYGVSQVEENFRFRVTGMAMTFTVLLSASVYLLYLYFQFPQIN
ncbi:MAG: MAPEG family protein [Moraxellaceae bacterium]|nr:MAPEG family protein [Pseudobdellovibrionaceae bacterium]